MDIVGLLWHFFQGTSVGFIASIPLGPIGVMCIQRTLNKGRASGFVSGLGAATSDLVYALIAGFSVSFIMDFVNEQQKILTILGALVLFGMGLKIFLSNPITEMRRRQHQEMLLKQVEQQVPQLLYILSYHNQPLCHLRIPCSIQHRRWRKNHLYTSIFTLRSIHRCCSLVAHTNPARWPIQKKTHPTSPLLHQQSCRWHHHILSNECHIGKSGKTHNNVDFNSSVNSKT